MRPPGTAPSPRPPVHGHEVAAAHALRRLALDEGLKARTAEDPALSAIAWRVAHRYVAGRTLPEVLPRVRELVAAGHATTVDFMGESARRASVADAATEEFLRLVTRIAEHGPRCSVSLDLSHLGSVIDRELGLRNATRVAEATAAAGLELVLSMEGHDRIDQILDDHAVLGERFDHVGITLQARLHRSPADLEALLDRPGRIRLVKGSYDVPERIAVAREDPELPRRFDALAERLLRSGHPCLIATHDIDRLLAVDRLVDTASLRGAPYVIEVLDGLGVEQIRRMRERGHPTQVYLVYGTEWWLYVLNRIAEDPQRVLLALVDAAATGVPSPR
ncbi:MAG TPA: proline dehydrogenase family protein [Pseudonocardia sp.]|nr:proline dehydrogenase family protein [Pseudonocardia sp.]